jgi:23S rRNA pseudoU1915 N3-methylase RlmH
VKLTIAWIGKTRESAIQTLTDDYLKRLARYCDVEGVSLKDEATLIEAPAPQGIQWFS